MRARQEAPGFRTVSEALEREGVDHLKKLAALVPGATKVTRKAELVAYIAASLSGSGLQATWERLDTLQQAAVAETVHGTEPFFKAAPFKAKYGSDPNWGTEQSPGWAYGRLDPSLLGLFFYSYERAMPDDLRVRLKAFVPKPSDTAVKTIDEPPATRPYGYWEYDHTTQKSTRATRDLVVERRDMERAAVRDLVAVLRLVGAGKLAVSEKTRLPSLATVAAVSEVLDGGDFYEQSEATLRKHSPASFASREEMEDWWNRAEDEIGPMRAFAWPMLLQATGLVELAAKKLRLTKAGQKALTAPAAETLRAIWQRWMRTMLLDEFSRIDAIKGQGGKKGRRGLTAVSLRRQAVAAALADCPVGSWIEVEAFWDYTQAALYDIQVTRDPWSLYLVDPNYGSFGYAGYATFAKLEGRYILCLLFEYGATLGMVDVAYVPPAFARSDYREQWGADDIEFLSRYDGLIAFRLTPLGAYCLGAAETYTPPAREDRRILQVLPNLDVVCTGELSRGDSLLLDTFAERDSDAVWKLDRARMLEATEAGHDISELRDFLVASGGSELPQPVERLLADVAERAERVRYQGPAQLFECADAELAVLIANDSRTKALCMLAGTRHLAVPASAEARFRRALRQLGYSVKTGGG